MAPPKMPARCLPSKLGVREVAHHLLALRALQERGAEEVGRDPAEGAEIEAALAALAEYTSDGHPHAEAALHAVFTSVGAAETVEVAEQLCVMRLRGVLAAFAFNACGMNPGEFARRVCLRDSSLVDAVNRELFLQESADASGLRLPPALYESPQCAECGAAVPDLECPYCRRDRRGPDALFVCSDACFRKAWPRHSGTHDERARRRRRNAAWRRQSLRRIVQWVSAVLPLLVVLAFLVPLSVYFYTIWTRKYLGWYTKRLPQL
eukprot:TRINITY_DN45093_c0_g1_i1.p1 TRINITY_DN45093_c0_g1~~TRINITY_DN45093_c0_g1_i1.p1  ORF type:complete len:288 (+),score=97.75 TRINITY_DN45093_c0_g1_i1:73-864(+)